MNDKPLNRDFKNFDLQIDQGQGGDYPVSVLYSPGGATRAPAQISIRQDEEWLSCLESLGEGNIEQSRLQVLGRQLMGYLFPPGPVRDLFQHSRGKSEEAGLGLRVRLRIAPPELAALPWEYAYDEAIADFLVLDPRIALVRYHSEPVSAYSIGSYAPVPILVLTANPAEAPSIQVIQEVTNLISALSQLLAQGQVTVDLLASVADLDRQAIADLVSGQSGVTLLPGSASVDSLRDALRQGYRVLHYIGHGSFDRETGGMLLLTDDYGRSAVTSAQTLARELRSTAVGLVVLNACQSATDSTAQSFMGLAPSLIQAGVPAVVAMQYAIADQSAMSFSHTLYKALADGWPLDAAITEGRKAIGARASGLADVSWGIPVLFMRSEDGFLWKDVATHLNRLTQRASTVAEEADRARTVEDRRLAEGIHHYTQQLQKLARQLGVEAVTRRPYKGLQEYELSDAGRFFGRASATSQMMELIETNRLTVLHAVSGAGKTSLLKAGLSPRLIEAGSLPVHMRPFDVNPADALKRQFMPNLSHVPDLAAAPLRDFLWRVCGVLGDEPKLYVFVDQFEEFFTYLPAPGRQAFVDELAQCLEDPGLRVHWVLALRSEYFGHLATFRPRIRNPFESDYRLDRLTRAEAREVVIRPAELAGISFEPGLVDTLLDDLGKNDVLPSQAQLVCADIFEELQRQRKSTSSFPDNEVARAAAAELRQPGLTTITRQLYDRMGGAPRILQDYLQRVLTHYLLPDQRIAAQLVLEALITSDVRSMPRTHGVLVQELARHNVDVQMMDAVLAQLEESHLVRKKLVGAASSELAYELVHDYLASQIEISPEVRGRKAAQELLEREVLNKKQFNTLMHRSALEAVGGYRNALSIDEVACELLVGSALETDTDLAGWLAFVPPDLAIRTLLAGLKHADPFVRARAASHLAGASNDGIVAELVDCALYDNAEIVRTAAFNTLERMAPAQACQVLLAGLEDPASARRAQAARQLDAFLDEKVVARLFQLAARDEAEAAWQAALDTLADRKAAPYRFNWRPLLQAGMRRQAEAYGYLKAQEVVLPRSVRWRMVPTRAVSHVLSEARTRPAWLIAQVAILVAVYLGVAALAGWWPFLRWERVPGSPQESLASMIVLGDRLYGGSQHYGVVRKDANWDYWLSEGLPVGEKPGKASDPSSIVRTITAMAADPAAPNFLYAITDDGGLYASPNAGNSWSQVPGLQIPPKAVQHVVSLALKGNYLVVAADSFGLHATGDGGQTWLKLDGANGLPEGTYNAVRFTADGVVYAGGINGLYRAQGVFPWVWEQVPGIPSVKDFDIGPDGQLYLALGYPVATQASCYSTEGGLVTVYQGGERSVITALAAHPEEAGVFYASIAFKQVYRMDCNQKNPEALGQVPGELGANSLALMESSEGRYELLETTTQGLFRRSP